MNTGPTLGTPIMELVGTSPEFIGPPQACPAMMGRMGYDITIGSNHPSEKPAPEPEQSFSNLIRPESPSMG